MSTESMNDAVNQGLIALRFMVEGAGESPLSRESLEATRRAAELRLMERRPGIGSTLRRAIDLAIALDDPDLRRVVESLASDRAEVIRRGVTESYVIELTQTRAADRLAGRPPLPRWN